MTSRIAWIIRSDGGSLCVTFAPGTPGIVSSLGLPECLRNAGDDDHGPYRHTRAHIGQRGGIAEMYGLRGGARPCGLRGAFALIMAIAWDDDHGPRCVRAHI